MLSERASQGKHEHEQSDEGYVHGLSCEPSAKVRERAADYLPLLAAADFGLAADFLAAARFGAEFRSQPRALGRGGLSRPRLALRRRLCPLAWLGGRLALAFRQQVQSLGNRDRIRRGSLRNRRVDLGPVDVSAEPTVAHGDRPAVGMLADQAPDDAAARRLGFEQFNRLLKGQSSRDQSPSGWWR